MTLMMIDSRVVGFVGLDDFWHFQEVTEQNESEQTENIESLEKPLLVHEPKAKKKS